MTCAPWLITPGGILTILKRMEGRVVGGVSSMSSPTLQQWERLKRLTFIIDGRVGERRLTTPSVGDPDSRSNRRLTSGKAPEVIYELCRLVRELGLVSSAPTPTPRTLPVVAVSQVLDLAATKQVLDVVFGGEYLINGLVLNHVRSGLVQELCRHAYRLTVLSEGWPVHFPVADSGRVRTGIVAKSIDGKIEGRTTGGRRKCPSKKCNGWLVGVHWQTGQLLHICTEGWHYDPVADELRVIGGGAISARFVSPKPRGVDPLPRREWPARVDLMRTKAWSISTA